MEKSSSLDVLTVGGAVNDVFLVSNEFAPVILDRQPFLRLPAAMKIDIPDIGNDVGGGAMNAAVTFARTGSRVACLAKVGADGAAQQIIHALDAEGIINRLYVDKTHQTGITIVLKGPNGEDSMLTHRGAGYEYTKAFVEQAKVDCAWVYVTSLAGSIDILADIVKQSALQGSRIAVSPGNLEISKRTRLLRILKQADVVILNQDEAELLFQVVGVKRCMKVARRAGLHTIVITEGARGSWVLDGSYLYHAPLYKKSAVVDRTGAGDAYGAGLIAAIARGKSMQEAMSFASANATSVIGYLGARAGVLRNLEVDMMDINVSIFEGEPVS
ncbi:carbohydrate kinase family protein [bacterium]|nr:carbohydrate kinase family protein [bacterium]